MIAGPEWDRPTNGRPKVILHENGKEILIGCLTICVIILLITGMISFLSNGYNTHIEKMHEMGYAQTAIYEEYDDYERTKWVKGSGKPIILSDMSKGLNPEKMTHKRAIAFLKKELEIK